MKQRFFVPDSILLSYSTEPPSTTKNTSRETSTRERDVVLCDCVFKCQALQTSRASLIVKSVNFSILRTLFNVQCDFFILSNWFVSLFIFFSMVTFSRVVSLDLPGRAFLLSIYTIVGLHVLPQIHTCRHDYSCLLF